MDKKVVIARPRVTEGKEKEFLALVSPLIEVTRKEPGNLCYMIYQGTERPSEFIVYEEYVNEEAFNQHAASEHFKDFAKNVQTLLAKDIDIQIF